MRQDQASPTTSHFWVNVTETCLPLQHPAPLCGYTKATYPHKHTHTHFRTSTEVKAVWAGFCNGKKGIHKIHMQDGIHCYVVSGCFDVP